MKVIFRFTSSLFFASIVFLTSCGDAGDGANTDATADSDTARAVAEATITGTLVDSAVRGTARFEEQDGGRIRLQLQIMVPGKANSTVAVHIHQNGGCGDTANQAGPHWSPSGTQHGRVGDGNPHPGDFGNIDIDADGRGQYSFESDRWTLGGDSTTNILGRAIVVHSGVDDLTTQPAGNSGPRIGCGVIQRSSGTRL